MSKLSPEALATMNADTTTKVKPQELYRPNEVVAPHHSSSRWSFLGQREEDDTGTSDTYLAPQFQETFERVAKATMQEKKRAPGKSSCRIVPYHVAGQSPIR